MKILNQKGFTSLEMLLVTVVVLLIAGGGYYVYSNRERLPEGTDSMTGGPAADHVVTSEIVLVTGNYMPAQVDIKKGTTVTWRISDITETQYGIENDTDSTEKFSSKLLKTNDTFSHKFNTPGVYNWHDKYQGNLRGTVTVTE